MSKSEDLFVTTCKYFFSYIPVFQDFKKTFRLGAFAPFTYVDVELSKQNEQTFNIICDTK